MATSTTPAITNVPAPGSYTLDQSHSQVSFSARHLMVTKVRGRFPVTAGKLEISADPTQSHVEATIDAAAVDSGDPKRDEHLRSADFFDADKYPTINFTSTKVTDKGDGEFTLEGELTVTGNTHAVTLQGEYLGAQASPWGDTRIGFSAETEVSRKAVSYTHLRAHETGR